MKEKSGKIQKVFSGVACKRWIYLDYTFQQGTRVLSPGPAKKVTIHINEDTSSNEDFLSREIVALLLRENVAGATVFRPSQGFGSHHRMHSQEDGAEAARHMPVRIEFIESPAKVEALSSLLCELVTDGLIEIQDTVVLKAVSGTAQ
jgi:hypothetical protein